MSLKNYVLLKLFVVVAHNSTINRSHKLEIVLKTESCTDILLAGKLFPGFFLRFNSVISHLLKNKLFPLKKSTKISFCETLFYFASQLLIMDRLQDSYLILCKFKQIN